VTDEVKTLNTVAEIYAAFQHGDIVTIAGQKYPSGRLMEWEVLYADGGQMKFVPLPENPLARERRAKRKPE